MHTSRSLAVRLLLAAACIFAAALLTSQTAPREQVGPLPNGAFLLNSGWRLQPVGRQIPLDTLPMSTALTPDGKYMLVLNGGYRPPSISVIETAQGKVVSSIKVPDAWLGLAISPKGDRVYAGGGSQAAIFEFAFANGTLTAARSFPVAPEGKLGNTEFAGDVTFSPDGRLLYAAELYKDDIAVVNPQSGMVIARYKTGRRPYRILFHPDGKSYFVTQWADGTLNHYDATDGSLITRQPIGSHASDMLWVAGAPESASGETAYAARLFVAAANTNNVYVVGVSQGKQLSIVESINLAMTPRQPLGMTPSALAASPDRKRLYVACSDANTAAVVDISMENSHVEGFIPTGWYPTAVRALADGTLVVINGKGLRSYPNPQGPSPMRRAEPVHEGVANPYYVGAMQTGTASWIPPFTRDQLEQWTTAALSNMPYNDEKLDETSPLPPIEHVIYIVRENRTYDQVLGDMKQGNSDPSLVLFGENITPNLHKLASQFVLLDNFYVNADVSADGHNWSTAAIAPDYVQKLWPNKYANRRKLYDFEEQDPASLPPAGYIWTAAAQAGISFRNYGYMVNNKTVQENGKAVPPPPGAEQITGVRDPVLKKSTNSYYRGFDLNYPDMERAKTFISDLHEFEKSGNMPRLLILRMGNDHTNGAAAGKLAPLSSAADNDYSIGMLVEAVSKSRFWTSTAIFIVEDDAQNGPDHVDSHRSPAFVISAWAKRHTVDSSMYNTTSMLRTMEFLLGLRPLTHFDAGARPMTAVFLDKPDPTPYTAEKPRHSLSELNPPGTPAAKKAALMDFDDADEVDDADLNDMLWRAIRKDPPPPPVRSYFGK